MDKSDVIPELLPPNVTFDSSLKAIPFVNVTYPTTERSLGTTTLPLAASNLKSPPLVVIVVVPAAPIVIPSICASENALPDCPRYAPTSASGIIPVLNVTLEAKVDAELTLT